MTFWPTWRLRASSAFAVCCFVASRAYAAQPGPSQNERVAHAHLPPWRGYAAVQSAPDIRALAAGMVLLGVGYALALSVPIAKDWEGQTGWLAVPLAGPWIALGSGWDLERPSAEVIALDGVVQASGGLLLAGAFAYPRRILGPAQSWSLTVQPHARGLSIHACF
jgi:hypothetical protein